MSTPEFRQEGVETMHGRRVTDGVCEVCGSTPAQQHDPVCQWASSTIGGGMAASPDGRGYGLLSITLPTTQAAMAMAERDGAKWDRLTDSSRRYYRAAVDAVLADVMPAITAQFVAHFIPGGQLEDSWVQDRSGS